MFPWEQFRRRFAIRREADSLHSLNCGLRQNGGGHDV